MTGEELIKDVEKIVSDSIDFVQRRCMHFSEDQMNWRPSEGSWSIAEVFAHLNKYANYYHPTFESKIIRTKFRTPSPNFQSSPLGKASWKSMKLGNAKNVKRKFNAAISYNPRSNPNLVVGSDHELFIENQNKFLSILHDAKAVNIRKAKVSISLSKIIKFRLGDALLFVVYHDERHVEQIKKITAHQNFPKKK